VRPPASALRLRLSRIETKPKPVYVERWTDFARIGNDPVLQDEFDAIIESIERGDGVPEVHYRAGIDSDPDDLLKQRGIMHLHLGGKNSDVLVFLIQYADRVVLLESNTHVHFRTQPAGKNILALSQSWLANLEKQVQVAAEAARAAAVEAEREAAEADRARIAASIAAFKAKAGLR
jgi:hypothetical protein